MRSKILHIRSNFHFRRLELLVLQQVSVGVSFVWRKFTAKQSNNSPNGWFDFSEPVSHTQLVQLFVRYYLAYLLYQRHFITDGTSGYTFVAISLNATIVISFVFVAVVVVELRLASSIGCPCCA